MQIREQTPDLSFSQWKEIECKMACVAYNPSAVFGLEPTHWS